jgi:hypothetical protein
LDGLAPTLSDAVGVTDLVFEIVGVFDGVPVLLGVLEGVCDGVGVSEPVTDEDGLAPMVSEAVRLAVRLGLAPKVRLDVGETLMPALIELDAARKSAMADPAFLAEFRALLRDYVGRPTPVDFAARLTAHAGGARIFLKREDLTKNAVESGSAETITVSDEEYPALLERVYRAEKFGRLHALHVTHAENL